MRCAGRGRPRAPQGDRRAAAGGARPPQAGEGRRERGGAAGAARPQEGEDGGARGAERRRDRRRRDDRRRGLRAAEAAADGRGEERAMSSSDFRRFRTQSTAHPQAPPARAVGLQRGGGRVHRPAALRRQPPPPPLNSSQRAQPTPAELLGSTGCYAWAASRRRELRQAKTISSFARSPAQSRW